MLIMIKQRSFILFFVITAMLLVSCKKYLTLEPQSSFDEKAFFTTVVNARSAVLGAYDQLAGRAMAAG